jgi:hypothetical protein
VAGRELHELELAIAIRENRVETTWASHRDAGRLNGLGVSGADNPPPDDSGAGGRSLRGVPRSLGTANIGQLRVHEAGETDRDN